MTVDELDVSSSSQRSPGVRRAVSLVLLRIAEVAMEGKCPPAGGAVEFERHYLIYVSVVGVQKRYPYGYGRKSSSGFERK